MKETGNGHRKTFGNFIIFILAKQGKTQNIFFHRKIDMNQRKRTCFWFYLPKDLLSSYLLTTVSNRDLGIQNEHTKTSINLCLLMLRKS